MLSSNVMNAKIILLKELIVEIEELKKEYGLDEPVGDGGYDDAYFLIDDMLEILNNKLKNII